MEAAAPGFLFTVFIFLAVLTVLVFVHEWGHYFIARKNGVKVDVFSIGFGPEIFGWNDANGTRWKISWIPLGGYVKFFGDLNAASAPGEAVQHMTAEEKAVAFHHKSLGQRAAIVAAGPVTNFLFAILIYIALYLAIGVPFTPATLTEVTPDSAAQEAGFLPGDTIIRIEDKEIDRFEKLTDIIRMNPGKTMEFGVLRDGAETILTATPRERFLEDRFGNQYAYGFLGVAPGPREIKDVGPFEAGYESVGKTIDTVQLMLVSIGQIIMGVRSVKEMGGPLRIAQISGETASRSAIDLVLFVALVSINLGLVNLFPIPMLDGGHLLFYGIEAVRRRPLSLRAQEMSFMAGLAVVLTLFVFLTIQDLNAFKVWDAIESLL